MAEYLFKPARCLIAYRQAPVSMPRHGYRVPRRRLMAELFSRRVIKFHDIIARVTRRYA